MATKKSKKSKEWLEDQADQINEAFADQLSKLSENDVERLTGDPAYPKIVQGSHLTVITYQDGRTVLEWDDEALARDVREAIASYESNEEKPAVKTKATRKKKEA